MKYCILEYFGKMESAQQQSCQLFSLAWREISPTACVCGGGGGGGGGLGCCLSHMHARSR